MAVDYPNSTVGSIAVRVLAPLPWDGGRYMARVKDSRGDEVFLGIRDTEEQARRHAAHAVKTEAPFGHGIRL